MTERRNEDGWKSIVETVGKFLVPFIVMALGWMFTYMNKLEERIFTLQATSVSEAKLAATEQRLLSYMDVRLGDMNAKLELILKSIDMQNRYQKRDNTK